MKKIKFVLALLLCVLFLPVYEVYAYSGSFYVIPNNTEYTYDINVINNSSSDYNNIGYTDQALKNYIITNIPKYKHGLNAGTVTWENPDYVIKEEFQTVNVIYNEALTNKELIVPVSIQGTPYLACTELSLDVSMSFDINIVGKIPNSSYRWSCDNNNVINIDSKTGDLIAISYGKSRVKCEIFFPNGDKKTLICNVVVEPNLTDIVLPDNTLTLAKQNQYSIDINGKPNNHLYYWYSDNTNIYINPYNGVIEARKIGASKVMCAVKSLTDRSMLIISCDVKVIE